LQPKLIIDRERAFLVPYDFKQAQTDSRHITHLITQLEQLLDSVNLTFTLDHKFDLTNLKDVVQQLKQETTESKTHLNVIARNASSVIEQVTRFEVMQYEYNDQDMERQTAQTINEE
jgi:hypothetical protein